MFEHGYALLIGVDQNKLPRLALPTVQQDVTKLHEVLTHPDRCGYPGENVRLIAGPEATRANILDGLDWLKAKLDADSHASQTAFIYYSGHAHREATGEAYLIPYDFRMPIGLGGLAAADFAQGIAGLQPRRLLVVLDCCHAEALNVKSAAASPLTTFSPAALTVESPGLALLAEGEGRAVLSSSRGSQQSWIRKDGKMSVFTYHLVEALTGRAGRPAWPDVTVTEVMEYVGREVPKTAQAQHGATQEPVFRYSGTAFPVALVLGGKGAKDASQAPDPLAPLPSVRATLEVDELEGKATVVDADEIRAGEINATGTVKHVAKGAELTGVKVKIVG